MSIDMKYFEEMEALVAATRRLTKKAAATPSTPVPAPQQSVKPIKQNDGTVRYFEEEDDDVEDLKVPPPWKSCRRPPFSKRSDTL